MGRRRTAASYASKRGAASFAMDDGAPVLKTASHLSDFQACLNAVKGHKDSSYGSYEILKHLADNFATYGLLLGKVYHQIIKEGLTTAVLLQKQDPSLLVFINNSHRKNFLREYTLSQTMLEHWRVRWELDLGFANIPSRDLLELLVPIAKRYTIDETLQILKQIGRKRHSDGLWVKPTKTHLTTVLKWTSQTSSSSSACRPSSAATRATKVAPTAVTRASYATVTRASGNSLPTIETRASSTAATRVSSTAATRASSTAATRASESFTSSEAESERESQSEAESERESEAESHGEAEKEVEKEVEVEVEVEVEKEVEVEVDLDALTTPGELAAAVSLFEGRPYTTLRLKNTLQEQVAEQHCQKRTAAWDENSESIIDGNVLLLSSDDHIMAVKVDPFNSEIDDDVPHILRSVRNKKRPRNDPHSNPDSNYESVVFATSELNIGGDLPQCGNPPSFAQAMAHGFAELRHTWARKRARKSEKTDTDEEVQDKDERLQHKLLKRRYTQGVANALPSPQEKDHRHHDFDAMRALYGPSRCGVFHFAYWIPLGQNQDGPCLSADTCPGSYRHTAVARFLKSTQGFQLKATEVLQAIAPRLEKRYRSIIKKVQEWDPGFRLFGDTSYLGMAVLHNLRVGLHTDEGDDKYGFIVMTNFGNFTKGHLVIGSADQRWTLRYPPGSYCAFRSSIMEHAITPFQGTRTSIVLFSKDNTLRYVENHDNPPIPYLEDMGLDTDRE